MKRTIVVVYTNDLLREDQYIGLKTYKFICEDDRVQLGDMIVSPMYNTPMQVVGMTSVTNQTQNGIQIKTIIIKEIIRNKQPLNSNKMEKKSVFNSFIDKYKAQFIPEKEESLKLSMDGSICAKVGDEWIGADKNNNLTAYPAEMCIDIPVYTINKPFNQVKVGDIIKVKSSFVKVMKRNTNGTLQCLSFAGYSSNKQEVKDFILGQGFVKVVINMFSEMTNNGLNPMMLMALNSEETDIKDLIAMQMMQGGNTQFNPMMLLLMDKGENSSMMETMFMMQMMGGQNPLSNLMSTTTESKKQLCQQKGVILI